MSPTPILVEPHRHYVKWCINRPSRGNGIGPTVINALVQLLKTLKASPPKNQSLVITAAPITTDHRRLWITGGDLKELAALESINSAYDFAGTVSDFTSELGDLPIPVLMAIDGEAIGGGAELALTGDVRLATERSSFEFRQMAMGLTTGFGGTHRLVHLAGLTQAESLLYGMKQISAHEAYSMGLIHDIVQSESQLWQQIEEWAERFAQIEPATFAAQKKMFRHSLYGHPGAARETETRLFASIWQNPTHRRKMDQFLNKSK